jgi:hypothetical protein
MEDRDNQQGEKGKKQVEQQPVDKAPGEERGQGDKLTPTDLKGKKVDGDPSKESDQPSS